MSPLPISRSALDRLGERLAASDEISDDDYDLLQRILETYREALTEVRERLTALGYAPTTRIKTTGVLVDKLRREREMKLKAVQDVAGARIVTDGGRSEQDEIVTRIADEFADGARPPRIRDRRAQPSAGYRAVHVVVTVQDVPVEIQVRTQRQDQWAQIVEALGDKWGRGIRYGEGPPDPGLPISPQMDLSRERFWRLVLSLSDTIELVETGATRLEEMRRRFDRLRAEAALPLRERTQAQRELRKVAKALTAAEAQTRENLALLAQGIEHVQ